MQVQTLKPEDGTDVLKFIAAKLRSLGIDVSELALEADKSQFLGRKLWMRDSAGKLYMAKFRASGCKEIPFDSLVKSFYGQGCKMLTPSIPPFDANGSYLDG